MRNLIMFAICAAMCGCMGEPARPVNRYEFGDEFKTQTEIRKEVQQLQEMISDRKKSINDRNIYNASCGVTGWFVPGVWLLMDAKAAEEIEIASIKKRQQLLLEFFDKDTDFGEVLRDPNATVYLSTRLSTVKLEHLLCENMKE